MLFKSCLARVVAMLLVSFLLNETQVSAQCGVAPSSGTFNVSTANVIMNSYYPGANSPVIGATTLTVGTIDARGNSALLASGDLVVIMQMQGVDYDFSNTSSYGDGVSGGNANGYLATNLFAGAYEYNTVVSLLGGTLTLTNGLANNYYTQAYNGTVSKRAFQVIRVTRHFTLNINASSSISAPAWNGATGGVVVLEAANTINFLASTSSITVSGKGFRGGGGKLFTGANPVGNSSGAGALTATDYRFPSAVTNTANTTGGAKGEGVAGTPIYYRDTTLTSTTTGANEGYLGGSMGWGAPANAGGGGTDGAPIGTNQNQYNPGGGGGGNGGLGGRGGSGWDGTGGNASTYPTGGYGGSPFAQASISQIVMGGGGGAGTENNTPAANEYYSSGASGGGIIIMRAKSYSGSGSVLADGIAALDESPAGQTDAAGGGGAGGSVIVVTNAAGATGLGSIVISAKGGNGGNMSVYYSHGPGGGGGGGFILTNGAVASATVTGGINGFTHTCCAVGNPLTDPYGATAGAAGTAVVVSGVPNIKNPNNLASPCGILPLLLKDFKAIIQNETDVWLSWTVENEVNFNRFTIEVSTDGTQFSDAGSIAFITGRHTYDYVHTPRSVNGFYYYRLRLIDNDGRFSYSNVLAVKLKSAQARAFSIYPNPAKSNITVQLTAAASQASELQVFDNNGKLIFRKLVSLAKGTNFISFPEIDQVPTGLYHLRIVVDGISKSQKLLRE